MEAMGVEDAVRDILLFCISYFYCNGIFSARWRPLPWDWLALADEVQEERTGHSFWIDLMRWYFELEKNSILD